MAEIVEGRPRRQLRLGSDTPPHVAERAALERAPLCVREYESLHAWALPRELRGQRVDDAHG